MLLYALLYLCGDAEITLDQIRNFRQLGARPPGIRRTFLPRRSRRPPDRWARALPIRSGFAIAEEALRARFGKKLVDHHTYVIAGDGCLMEGVSQEAIGLAGR